MKHFFTISFLLLTLNLFSQEFIVRNKYSKNEYAYTKTISKSEITELNFYGDQDSLAKLKEEGVDTKTHLIKESYDVIDIKGLKNGNELKFILDFEKSNINETRNGKKNNFESPFDNLKAFGEYNNTNDFILDSIQKYNLKKYNYNLLKKEIQDKLQRIKFPKDTIFIGEKLKFSEQKLPVSDNLFLIWKTYLTLKKIENKKGFFVSNSEMSLSQENERIDFEFTSDGDLIFDFENNIILYHKSKSYLEMNLELNDGISTNIKNTIIVLMETK